MFPCIVDSAVVDDTRVGMWFDLFDTVFNKLKRKYGGLSFSYPIHYLQLGDQDATTGHYAVTYTTGTIEGAIIEPSTNGMISSTLGYFSPYTNALMTMDVVEEGDKIYIESTDVGQGQPTSSSGGGFWYVTAVVDHFIGDSFYFRDCKLSRVPDYYSGT